MSLNLSGISAMLSFRSTDSWVFSKSKSRSYYKRGGVKLLRLEAQSLIQEQLDSELESLMLDWDEAILENLDRFLQSIGDEVSIECDCACCMPDAPWNQPLYNVWQELYSNILS